MKKAINRRKFFTLTGIAALGTAIIAGTPLKFVDRTKRISIKTKVKQHPDSVKRTK